MVKTPKQLYSWGWYNKITLLNLQLLSLSQAESVVLDLEGFIKLLAAKSKFWLSLPGSFI